MENRFPMWLRVVERPGATVFALLSTCESFARALVVGVIPLEAYALLETARNVSIAYSAIGVLALVASFLVPLLMRRVARRWIFSAGCLFMVAAPLLLWAAEPASLVAALQLRALAVVCVNIALNLYILDYIRRKDFVTAEPRRLAFMGIAWSIGPGLGVWLYSGFGLAAVCLPSAAAAGVTLAYFWILRLRENPAVAPAVRKPPTPWRNIRRYLEQPWLRLAWIITFARSTFWATFFVYPPLYIAKTGGSETITAILLSASQALLFAAPLFGRLGARHGIRRPIVAAFALSGALSILVGLIAPTPIAAAILFFSAAIGAAVLDALGNIPFLRFVHAHERAEMASVFRTYIEVSQLLPAAAYAALLSIAPLPAVFVALGVVMLATGWLARLLPRRL